MFAWTVRTMNTIIRAEMTMRMIPAAISTRNLPRSSAAGWARAEKLKILPLCSYAGAVLNRSPAHADLLE